jgi:hypothetical protein
VSRALVRAALFRLVATRWRAAELRGAALEDLLRAPAAMATRGVDATLRAQAMVHAARWVPGATCLVRGAALVRWLRADGVPATLAIGVRADGAMPRAHAWVEVDGAPVGEDAAALASFRRLAAPPPRAAWSP